MTEGTRYGAYTFVAENMARRRCSPGGLYKMNVPTRSVTDSDCLDSGVSTDDEVTRLLLQQMVS